MGTHIEAAATAQPHRHLFGRSALRLSDLAATSCLDRARRRPCELDLMINAGLYKDRNAAEPALASIIQGNIGANQGDPPQLGGHGTFSFDVLNGGCSVITAAQLVDGFVGAGTAKLGLIVAADADPSPRTSRGFPFRPVGGAMLIAHAPGDAGFQCFALHTFPEYTHLFEVELRWKPKAGLARRGANAIEVYEAPGFASCCVERAAEVAAHLLAGAGLSARDVDLMLASQYPTGFAKQVARRLGIHLDCVPDVAPDLAAAHTAGPIAALEAAIRSRRFAGARHTCSSPPAPASRSAQRCTALEPAPDRAPKTKLHEPLEPE
jgi:3-oxoacyl-[acyl-carrier-protein] synthase-3